MNWRVIDSLAPEFRRLVHEFGWTGVHVCLARKMTPKQAETYLKKERRKAHERDFRKAAGRR